MFLLSHLWWALAIVVFLTSLCIFLINAFRYWQSYCVLVHCCEKVPQYKMMPFVTYYQVMKQAYQSGNARVFLLQVAEAACYVFRKEGITLFWIGVRPIVLLFKAEIIEALVKSTSNISKAVEYNFTHSWIGTGLLTSTDKKWRKNRKLLTPCFHFQILENFFPVFNEQADIFTKKLELEVEKPWTDVGPMVTMCALSIICETVMGVRVNTENRHGKEYVENLEKINDFVFYRVIRPWLWSDSIFFNLFPSGWQCKKSLNSIHDFTKKIIKQKKDEMISQKGGSKTEKNATKKKKAFLEYILECHFQDESFTEENVKEEVDTFMFAGHDTISSALKWALYIIGRHPEIQQKVYQEIDTICQSECGLSIDYEDLKRMKYLECVIKESLRLYPAAFFVGRQLTHELEVGNYTLRPGCTCVVFQYALHRNPEAFPDPECFDPDRFLPENCTNRHPYAYVPFSAGPRNCIGQKFAMLEMKTVLAHILQKFKLTSLDPRDKTHTMLGFVLKNAQPIRINFALRR